MDQYIASVRPGVQISGVPNFMEPHTHQKVSIESLRKNDLIANFEKNQCTAWREVISPEILRSTIGIGSQIKKSPADVSV